MSPFRVIPLPAEPFLPHFRADRDGTTLAGTVVVTADSFPGFPCRLRLRDAAPGERLLLVNYEHQPAENPYRSRHAVFVTIGAEPHYPEPNQVPTMLSQRLLSVRAFDSDDMMVAGEVCEGVHAGDHFSKLLARDDVQYLQVHTATRGCFLAQVVRN